MLMEKNMNERFDKLERLIGNLYSYAETRFNKMDTRFDRIEERLERIEDKVDDNHEIRLIRLEDSMRLVKTKLGFQ